MLKKKVIPIAKNSIGLKCGDCLHFKVNAKFEKPCAQLGVAKFADAPACYSPNVYFLGRRDPNAIGQLGLLLRDFTAQDQRILLSVLKQSKSFEKHYNLKFGQPVYFCIGNDYLSNYFRGYVVGVAEVGESQVFVGSDLTGKQRGKPMTGTFLRDSVYTVTEFKKKRAQLQKDNRVIDPNPLFTVKRYDPKIEKVDYEPPTIDSAPSEWFNKEKPKGKDARISSKKLKKRLDGNLEFRVNRG